MSAIRLIALVVAVETLGACSTFHPPPATPAPITFDRRILPPPEYDRPYEGNLSEMRVDREWLDKLCPAPQPLACAIRTSTGCQIIIGDDDILQAAGLTLDIVRRHERAHCAGWPGDHPGARVWIPSRPPVWFLR
jgi:hypothetical protein